MITTVQSAVKIVIQQHKQAVQKEQEEQAAFTPYWKIPIIDDDDDDTILEMELDEVINSSMEDLVLIPSESKGISDDTCDVPFCDNSPPLDVLNSHFEIFFDFNDDYTSKEVKEDILHEKLLNINFLIACDLPWSDDFSPISIFEEKSVSFSNPLFDSNDDFTSSDNESLSDEDVPEDRTSSARILMIPTLMSRTPRLLVTPLFDSNEDECLAPSDDIELLLHHDPSISVVSILEGFTDEPPLEENDDLFDLESKENDWKKILYDAPIDDLITEDKVFDLEIH
ncbi:hypothetical protein Tco_0792583 [Tanacetum coccineum]